MEKCSHCASCEAICPVYLETLSEPMVARNRVEVIRETLYKKNLSVSARAREIISCCLLCTNCTQNCAARVPIDEVIIAGRSALREKAGVDLKTAVMGKMLSQRKLTGILSKAGSIAQKVGIATKDVPVLAGKTFEKYYQGTVPAVGETRVRVAYFVGCGTNFMWPDTGVATVKVLTHNGIEVVIPQGQVCCGIPSMAEGDLETTVNMIRTNIEIFADMDVDAIITDCTSCGMMFKEKFQRILPADDPLQEKAAKVAARIMEATDYLNQAGLVKQPGQMDKAFTYHVPCHRSWNTTVRNAPRELLGQIPGAQLKEMENPESCCGAGGIFYMEHGDLSRGIRSHRIEEVEATGVDTVVTQCPICRFYLRSGFEDKSVEVVHPMIMLERAYGI